MKKDVTNPQTFPSGVLLVKGAGASGASEVDTGVVDELNLIFRNCAKPTVIRADNQIKLRWQYNSRHRRSDLLTAEWAYPEDAQCSSESEANVVVRRKGEDVELGMMTLRQLCGVVRQFTGGYNPEGWRAQTFRKQIGEWSAEVISEGDKALLLIRQGRHEVERYTLMLSTWDSVLSSAESRLVNAMRRHKMDARLMQSARDRRRIQAQKLTNLRREVDQAEGAEGITLIYKNLADEDPKVRKEFLKLISRKGFRLNRETGSIT